MLQFNPVLTLSTDFISNLNTWTLKRFGHNLFRPVLVLHGWKQNHMFLTFQPGAISLYNKCARLVPHNHFIHCVSSKCKLLEEISCHIYIYICCVFRTLIDFLKSGILSTWTPFESLHFSVTSAGYITTPVGGNKWPYLWVIIKSFIPQIRSITLIYNPL